MNQFNLGPQSQGPDIKRLLLAGALMTGFLMVYSHFFAPRQEASTEAPSAAKASPSLSAAPAVSSPQLAANVKATPEALPLKEKTFEVNLKETASKELSSTMRGGYEVTVSNQGGQVTAFRLKGYEDTVDLASPAMEGIALLGLQARDNTFTLPVNAAYEMKEGETKNQIAFERLTPEGIRVTRRYNFEESNFVIKQQIIFQNETASSKQIAFDIVAANSEPKASSSGFFSAPQEELAGVCKTGEKRSVFHPKDLKEGAQSVKGQVAYAGFDKRYFLFALMEGQGMNTQGCELKTVKGNEEKATEDDMLLSIQQAAVVVPAKGKYELNLSAYAGPKQLALLKAAGNNLDENVNFGWFGIISRPMLWLLTQIHHFVLNFGIAIILLTLLIKLATFPLTQKSYVSMQQMKTIAPEIKALQAKYANDRTMLGQKQMELYKQKGINPMAGCLPMLIQMPIWIALYQMLANSVELYHQPFALWVTNLTQADPYYILPVIMGLSMVVQTAFQPMPEDQPQMKYVFWFMPIFFTFIMLKMPAGLNLYILTNNLLTLVQQFYIKRRYGAVK